MKTPEEARAILAKLEGQHPNADTELDYHNPFELLVATILSAQTTDAGVTEFTPTSVVCADRIVATSSSNGFP